MQYNLENLWEMLEMFNTKPTDAEQKTYCEAEQSKSVLLRTLNDEQAKLFYVFEENMSRHIEAERKAAFIKGVKFATQFLFEATEKQTTQEERLMSLAENLKILLSASIAFDRSNSLWAKPKPILQAERESKSVCS